MRAKIFFAENADGCKLSFTRLKLQKGLENINKKYSSNIFTIVKYMIVRKPQIIKEFISNLIIDKKIEDSDLYNITYGEINEIFNEVRIKFNMKKSNRYSNDDDLEHNFIEDYDTEDDTEDESEYIPTEYSNDDLDEESSSNDGIDGDEEINENQENDYLEEIEFYQKNDNQEINNNILNKNIDQPNNYVFLKDNYETNNCISVRNNVKGKYYLVKEYSVIYTCAFILYRLYSYLK
jgi:hypothetical protein